MKPENEVYLSVFEVAKRLKVSRQLAHQFFKKGYFPNAIPATHVWIPLADLVLFEEKRKNQKEKMGEKNLTDSKRSIR